MESSLVGRKQNVFKVKYVGNNSFIVLEGKREYVDAKEQEVKP